MEAMQKQTLKQTLLLFLKTKIVFATRKQTVHNVINSVFLFQTEKKFLTLNMHLILLNIQNLSIILKLMYSARTNTCIITNTSLPWHLEYSVNMYDLFARYSNFTIISEVLIPGIFSNFKMIVSKFLKQLKHYLRIRYRHPQPDLTDKKKKHISFFKMYKITFIKLVYLYSTKPKDELFSCAKLWQIFFFLFQYKRTKKIPSIGIVFDNQSRTTAELSKKRVFTVQLNTMSYDITTTNIVIPSNNYSMLVHNFYILFFAKHYFFFKKKKILTVFKKVMPLLMHKHNINLKKKKKYKKYTHYRNPRPIGAR